MLYLPSGLRIELSAGAEEEERREEGGGASAACDHIIPPSDHAMPCKEVEEEEEEKQGERARAREREMRKRFVSFSVKNATKEGSAMR